MLIEPTIAELTIPFLGFEVPFELVVIGTITGLTYSLLGIGLVLVFTSSRVLNLAAGEMGALPGLMVPILVLSHGWPYWTAVPLALVGATVLGGLIEFLVIRRLARASRLTILVATIGLAQALLGIGLLIPRGGVLVGKRYPTPFDARVDVGGLTLGAGQLLILVVVPLVAIGLTVFLRRSALGRASRAAADNPEAASLAGIPSERISFVIWALVGLLAGLAAVLIGPTRPLNVSQALGPSLLLRALGAAMIGSLTRIPMTFAGGIVIGIAEALVLFNYPNGTTLELVLAGIIVVSLLVKRDLGVSSREDRSSQWSALASILPLPPPLARHPRIRLARWATLAAVGLLAAGVPFVLTPSSQFLASSVVLFGFMGLSLVVLTGYAGHVSLGQFAFVGVGAAVAGRLYQLGYPHLVGAAAVIVVGGLVAWVVGLPALRVRGLFLAVTTLAFALVVSGWMFAQDWLVTSTREFGPSLQLPRPELLGLDFEEERAYYWLCLGVLAVGAALVYRLRRSSLGQAMIAVRDNEAAAASLAWSPSRVKLTAFVVSGAIAALAGLLFGGLLTRFSSDPAAVFGADQSLNLMVTAVFGGVTTVTGVILGAVWIQGIPRILGEGYALVSSGFGLVLILILLPNGLASLVFKVRDRVVAALASNSGEVTGGEASTAPLDGTDSRAPRGARAATIATRAASGPVGPAGPAGTGSDAAIPLRAEEVTVQFGGIRALSSVSMEARQGELLGIMGPNGAGKTTLLDVLSGRQAPRQGRVHLHGRDVTGVSAHGRARLGLGRSFQHGRLFADLTVVECIALAHERRAPTRALPAVFGTPGARRRDRAATQAAAEVIEFLGIGDYAHRPVGDLPTGIRRLVQLGCVSALEADVLLLDEPTAGFTPREVASFSRVVDDVRTYLGATIVVVDHDVPMMRDLVDRLYVLDLGEVIAAGAPSLLDTDTAVATAYLGR